jgi:hypothetical protein
MGLAASGAVLAQSSVDDRVQKLEETIQVLERRIASLEAQLREQGAPASVAPDKANWRKLKQGMTPAQVEQLLGSPANVDEYGISTTWSYGPNREGSVTFYGTPRKTIRWSEP